MLSIEPPPICPASPPRPVLSQVLREGERKKGKENGEAGRGIFEWGRGFGREEELGSFRVQLNKNKDEKFSPYFSRFMQNYCSSPFAIFLNTTLVIFSLPPHIHQLQHNPNRSSQMISSPTSFSFYFAFLISS